jgi:hypothetical protein
VPQPVTFHVLVADLDHKLRPERDERQVLADVPAAELRTAGVARGSFLVQLRPVPRVSVEGGDQRLELSEQLLAAGGGERADHTHRGQRAVVLVEAEQQRSDCVRAALVHPIAGDHAVRGALVLDLEHHPLVRLVGAGKRLGDHPVQPGPFELGEPLLGQTAVAGSRGQMDRCLGLRQRPLQRSPPLGERPAGPVLVTQGQQVEGDERGRRLLRQQLDAARRRVNPLLQHLELQPIADHDDDLPVDDAPLRQVGFDRLDHFREVAGHRSLVAGADLHLVTVSEDDRSESVPLGLEGERPVRDVGHRLGEHRCNRGHNREPHPPIVRGRDGHPEGDEAGGFEESRGSTR